MVNCILLSNTLNIINSLNSFSNKHMARNISESKHFLAGEETFCGGHRFVPGKICKGNVLCHKYFEEETFCIKKHCALGNVWWETFCVEILCGETFYKVLHFPHVNLEFSLNVKKVISL